MCAGCAIAAMAGASGARSWLQTRHTTWLTPRRMRAATVTLFLAATGVSSVGLSGSSTPVPARSPSAVSTTHVAR
jgi:hypothetical protein